MNEINGLAPFQEMIPIPMCVLDKDGRVVDSNSLIGDVFIYDDIVGGSIFALTGIKFDRLKSVSETNEPIHLERNEKIFNLVPTVVESNGEEYTYVYFMDVTQQEKVEKKYDEEKVCIVKIHIDNYDELNSSTSVDSQMGLVSEIDKTIRKWASGLSASVNRQKENVYIVLISKGKCRQQMEAKFPILDRVREIESSADFPVTLSIGIGFNGDTPEQRDEASQQALDLALGRGGDQAVVKDGDKILYFGGATATVEKNNKGKSRIIGHALKRLVQASSKIFIMGHKNPDMDCFGASMGISRMAKAINKETYIVLEEFGEALALLYNEAKESGEYNLINRKRAVELIDEQSLVIILDTHKPSITECPELLDVKTKRVIIDHHRKGEEFIENPTLVYTEPYASSTSELVTEILQYTIDRKELTKLEAEGLLSGIFVDTNHFSVKTGVRTFEAAAWLRRVGADLSKVKRLFQVGKELFMSRVKGVSNAQFEDNGIIYTICDGENPNAQMICSLVADELLTVRGTRKVFAVGKNHKGRTIISARSVGANNVQLVMEKLGGGGHLNAAGAQVDMEPAEVIEKIKNINNIMEEM
ncbi:MAG: DHH family phosphoesterase [Eubacterium sp.]|nr:DHH family phosphoesterase [Eubacterium sp.]